MMRHELRRDSRATVDTPNRAVDSGSPAVKDGGLARKMALQHGVKSREVV
jgi:hypothetical protein